MNKHNYTLLTILLVVAVLITGSFGLYAIMQVANPFSTSDSNFVFVPGIGIVSPNNSGHILSNSTVKQFGSEEEFRAYLEMAPQNNFPGNMMAMRAFDSISAPTMMAVENGMANSELALGSGGGGEVSRVSETNVQVAGIDEPDIVKTNGDELFVSSPNYWIGLPEPILFDGSTARSAGDERIATTSIAPRYVGGIKSIKAFPPEDIEVAATIEASGDLLLYNDTLVVFAGQDIVSYNVASPEEPKSSWEMSLDDNTYLAESRLIGDTLYLITRTWVNSQIPCPLRPLRSNGVDIIVPCTAIYHPITPIAVDSTFTVHAVEVETGKIRKSTSFVGSSGQSVTYMSEKSLYVTYPHQADQLSLVLGFFQGNTDLVPDWLLNRLAVLKTMDISSQAKMTELNVLLGQWQQSLDQDDMLTLTNELENRASKYLEENSRDIDRTGIVKVDLDDLDVVATGSVAGSPLNQFSLDEYNGDLRIATTIGRGGISLGFYYAQAESVSDVTVLNKDLSIIGSVQNLGRDERIYSVRFVKDMGYVVTFKQIDPFFVLDLSDPRNPTLEGELKIPGFSSYLHPLADDLIVGIGREDSQVKISLFDVSNHSNPLEVANYKLSEYWSEVQNTHHAFLHDDKHEIFFLPGNQGGYIFSYDDNKLTLEKAVSTTRARRALFINDYLYVISDDELVVLDENTWERVNELSY